MLFRSIKKRNQDLFFSLREDIDKLPEEIIQALIFTTLARLMKQTQIPRCQHYQAIIKEFKEKGHFGRALGIGHRILNDPIGQNYDLKALYQELIAEYAIVFSTYFNNYPPQLGWMLKSTYRRMGFYEQTSHTIALSRSLDTQEVPRFVVKYVLYHEMLHAFLGGKKRGKQRRVHHTRFKELERIYPDYERAELMLQQLSKKIKTQSR